MTLSPNQVSLQKTWQGLSDAPCPDGQGKIFAFVSAKSNSGTSFIVRQLAQIASLQSQTSNRRVLIIDMDLQKSAQAEWFFSPRAQTQFGPPQGPYDACFGAEPFWRVTPSMVGRDGLNQSNSVYMSLHMVPQSHLTFSCFHWEKFMPGQTVLIQNARQYWHALRAQFGAILVDIPALDRADLIGTICPEADQTVLVSDLRDIHSEIMGQAYRRLQDMNAHCAGMILNELPVGSQMHGGLA